MCLRLSSTRNVQHVSSPVLLTNGPNMGRCSDSDQEDGLAKHELILHHYGLFVCTLDVSDATFLVLSIQARDGGRADSSRAKIGQAEIGQAMARSQCQSMNTICRH